MYSCERIRYTLHTQDIHSIVLTRVRPHIFYEETFVVVRSIRMEWYLLWRSFPSFTTVSGIDTEPRTGRVAFTGFPTVTTGHGYSFSHVSGVATVRLTSPIEQLSYCSVSRTVGLLFSNRNV